MDSGLIINMVDMMRYELNKLDTKLIYPINRKVFSWVDPDVSGRNYYSFVAGITIQASDVTKLAEKVKLQIVGGFTDIDSVIFVNKVNKSFPKDEFYDANNQLISRADRRTPLSNEDYIIFLKNRRCSE